MRYINTRNIFLATAISALAFGCGESTDEQISDTDSLDNLAMESMDLELENGGIDEADEAPAFASALAADFPADEAVELAGDEVSAAMSGVNAVYGVRVVWGQLRGDRSVEDATEWSGDISTNTGAIKLHHTIRFEGRDHVVRPRESRQTVGFVSHTRPHHDGLAFKVFDVASDLAQAPQLDINLGPISLSYALDELDGLTDMQVVDELGNRVLVQAVRLDRPEPEYDCNHGFLSGRWRRVNARGGVFGARVLEAEGEGHGFIFGRWGVREDGDRVFVGKYVGPNGAFRGRLAGTYSPDGEEGGTFEGRWVNREGERRGVLSGGYRLGERAGQGFLRGRWANEACLAERAAE